MKVVIMQIILKPLLVIFTFMILAAMIERAWAAAPVTFVFGDSLTEVGNNNYLQYSLAKSNYPWYGVDYPGGQATGRFSNGRTIGDIISAKLGIASPPPYLSLSQNDDAFLKGVNYASGGAGILNDTGLYFIQRMSFDDQIQNFNKTREVIKSRIGVEAATKLCNEAMYFIGIGSNDYVNNYLQPFLADAQQYTHGEFVELLVSTLHLQLSGIDYERVQPGSNIFARKSTWEKFFLHHIINATVAKSFLHDRRLYKLDARKMFIHGLGPLGCIPSQRVKSKKGECLKRVNQWIQVFNSKVKNLVAALNTRLLNATLIFADTYPAVFDLISNPTAYGFKISNTSCCNVDTSIGGLCLPNSKLCGNRRDYVFWDAFHPSDAANEVLADKLFSTLFSYSPSTAPQPSH